MNDVYTFETGEEIAQRRYFVVISYDIYDNKRRRQFSKFLERYAIRVQRSVFEGELSKTKYERLVSNIDRFIDEDDNIRVYRISGNGKIRVWGKTDIPRFEETIII